MKTLLKIKNLNLSFKDNHVLKQLTFDVPEQAIVGLISPSGGGKTTTLKCLVGLQKPDSITMIYKNQFAVNNIAQLAGFSFQENSLYEDLTLEENMLFFGTQLGLKKEIILKRMNSIIDILKLKGQEKIVAKKFSGGMKKRLDIAITLLNNPEIILLDEPFSGLDKDMRLELWNLLAELKKMGKTLILTTHLLDEFDLYADYVVKIDNGKNIYQGFIKEIQGYWCLDILLTQEIDTSVFNSFKLRKKRENLIFYLNSKKDANNLFNQIMNSKYASLIKKVNIYKDTSSVIS